jgi:hypothetical protein
MTELFDDDVLEVLYPESHALHQRRDLIQANLGRPRRQHAPAHLRAYRPRRVRALPVTASNWLGDTCSARLPPEVPSRAPRPHLARPDRIAGLYVYTFNKIECAERWRHKTVRRLAGTA